MSAVSAVDVGPLTWVKGEIDLALQRATEALQALAANRADSGQLKFAQTHLHQAHGALAIVGLDGVTQVSEAVERLLEDLDKGAIATTSETLDLARRSLDALRHYLDDLVHGAPNQPLRLLGLYQDLCRLRGQPNPSPGDLFYPDLGLRPPRRAGETPALSGAQAAQATKAARAQFERGFLQWLRSTDGVTGLSDMRAAVATIEQIQTLPTARAFWWVTLGFLDILSERGIAADLTVKRLCARIDTQMRRLLEGARTVAERLMRDVLYYVATAPCSSEHALQVKAVYQLDALIPQSAGYVADVEPLLPALRALRESLADAKEAWNRFCGGAAVGLPQFEERLAGLSIWAQQLPRPDLHRLVGAVTQATGWLRRNPLAYGDAAAMEMATALLLVENAAENFEHLDADFARQANLVADRLAQLMRGEAPAPLVTPLLGEMSQHAQEQLFMGQVVREIQASLAEIEQALDAFFRNPTKGLEPSSLTTPIKQVEGALLILGQDRAVALLRQCAQKIERFAAPDYMPDQSEFEAVAHQLSGLGFFVEALQHGKADLDSILEPQRVPPDTTETETVEQELAQQRREAQELAAQLNERPEDALLRHELRQNLENIRQEATLVADSRLEQQAREALAALAAAPSEVAAEIRDKVAEIAPGQAVAPAPSAETARLAEAGAEELDAELLGIFVEEAHDVLRSIGEHMDRARDEPHNHDCLTTIRRGFHTLKGSGRMVGLKDFGEAAWGIEQVMNRWLQLELDATSELQRLIGAAHALFVDWIAQIEAGGSPHKDASAVTALAEQLRDGETTAPVSEPTPQPAGTGVAPQDRAPLVGSVEPFPSGEVLDLEAGLGLEPQPASAPSGEAAAPVAQEHEAADDTVQVGTRALSRPLYDLFLGEARSHAATLSQELGQPHPYPGPLPTEPIVRAAHTLAGISATVGFEPIHDLARALEHALARLGHATPGDEESELLNATVASLEAMVGGVAELRPPQPADDLITALAEIAPHGHETVAAEAGAKESGCEDHTSAAQPLSAPPAAPEEQPLLPGEMQPAAAAEAPAAAQFGERRKLRLRDDIDQQLLPIFLEEAEDLMGEIGAESRNWHAAPDSADTAHALKRLLHTLKGGARMAGAMALGELVHAIETRVEQAIAEQAVTPSFFEDFDNSLDRAAAMIDQLRGTPTAVPLAPADVPVAGAVPVAAMPEVAVVPAPATQPEEAEAAAAQAMLRVRSDLIDRFVNEAGEMSIARSRIEGEMRVLRHSLLDLTENVIRMRSQLRELEIQAESQMQSRQAAAEAQHRQFDPLEFDRFTRLQELTRMIAESVNDVTTVQHNVLKKLDGADAALNSQARLNRDLQQSLMSVRMVPFNSLADRLYRVVRQTAKELGKKANLDIRGGVIELDRSVLDKMTGPLEHLLRNSISHGLESAEERLQREKREIGQITLSLSQEGNEVAIELVDDGAGLDFGRIREKAVAAGWLAADAHPGEAQLADFIFRPGFSTAQELSELAGRGVGMDVVKNTTSALGGRIEVSSVAGQGARFRIYLPQSRAVTQALLVRIAGKTFAIPSVMVDQVMELRPDALATVQQEGAAEWLGNRYPYHYLPRLLGDGETRPQPARFSWLVLTRSAGQRSAVQVDELRGNQEIVVKNIGPQLSRVSGIAGATVLGDGEVVLIINPVALAGRGSQAVPGPALQPAAAPEPARPTVMVVDDSLTVRKIAGRFLEREGFRVITAKDGVDALEKLLDETPDVMLVDIEMPRMDGFDLTRNVRADARLKKVPIIMITSRLAEKHRSYAKSIGVNEYLGKPYQEEELLGLIRSYVGAGAPA